MKSVGSREFKNRRGRYMKAVRRGQSLLLTERGKPVAKVGQIRTRAPNSLWRMSWKDWRPKARFGWQTVH